MSIKRNITFFSLLSLVLFSNILIAQNQQDSSNNKTIIIRKNILNSLQIIKGDTLAYDSTRYNAAALPGEFDATFTKQQDSAFIKARNLEISSFVRLRVDLASSHNLWEIQKKLLEGSPWQVAVHNVQSIPRELYYPSPIDVIQNQINLQNSQFIPYVRTTPAGGARIPLSAIGMFLGIVEDVSPLIKYNLDYYSEVEIVIYSIQAKTIATIYKGHLPPGSYSITWNGRDDNGRKMPTGDYIGEVRVGREKYIRKHIVVP